MQRPQPAAPTSPTTHGVGQGITAEQADQVCEQVAPLQPAGTRTIAKQIASKQKSQGTIEETLMTGHETHEKAMQRLIFSFVHNSEVVSPGMSSIALFMCL